MYFERSLELKNIVQTLYIREFGIRMHYLP